MIHNQSLQPMAFVVSVLAFASCAAWAGPDLEGEWVSDKEESLRVARDTLALEDWEFSVLEQYFGNTRLSINASQITQRVPAFSVMAPEFRRDFEPSVVSVDYSVLGKDKDSVAILLKLPWSDEEVIITYHFVTDDLMWLDSSDQPSFGGYSCRQYFRRVE